ncbi:MULTISPECIES: KTSC domain-containing protein [Vibrio]|uniref:KTSC domain-containing protein n=1 Tax=Vibrio TaxID=662 RepID=UPI000C825FCB|nr:KTSC domain-containing protein [Vibrio cyclitrophicus]PME19618.1 KTSC domain-containing protein [Vibrio cyclitrophicus]PME95109.1 KTSC domain-containing protein [Vibrio cyclitrophicus]PMF30312.1 KTSC domain-containing protein [Vibrio cyclitrophicus]PMG14558.1 KTSC domain-containing protein [Vibrio cyclitrophicus]PMG87632.1 KTSC domain-containing protein [Vibrio cyclitrophicus]
MDMISVSSSNIDSIGYEDETLQIQFLNGSIYQYFDVPEHIFTGLIDADSAGKFLAANVKGTYRYSRV